MFILRILSNNLVRRALFREKTSFFKKRSNAVESIDDAKLAAQSNSETKENIGKKKSNLKGSKSHDEFSQSQPKINNEISEGRLKGLKNNISALNGKISGAFKGDNSNSPEKRMSVAKPPKTPGRTPGRGQSTGYIATILKTSSKHLFSHGNVEIISIN